MVVFTAMGTSAVKLDDLSLSIAPDCRGIDIAIESHGSSEVSHASPVHHQCSSFAKNSLRCANFAGNTPTAEGVFLRLSTHFRVA